MTKQCLVNMPKHACVGLCIHYVLYAIQNSLKLDRTNMIQH